MELMNSKNIRSAKNYDSCRFAWFICDLPLFLFSVLQDHGRLLVLHISKLSPFHCADSQDHGRLSVEHRSRHSRQENLYTRVGLQGPYHKKMEGCGHVHPG